MTNETTGRPRRGPGAGAVGADKATAQECAARSSGAAAKRGFHHGDLASALVAAASGLIAARGGADFSLREVAESVGVSHTAAYRHFTAKADLLAEIATRGFTRLEKAVVGATVKAAGGSDAVASLKRAGLAYIDFAERHPGPYRVMFMAELCDQARHPALAAAAGSAYGRLVEIVAAGQAAGVLRNDRPAVEIASAVWAAEHGHSMLLLDGQIRDGGSGPGGAPPASRAALIEMMVAGVVTRGV